MKRLTQNTVTTRLGSAFVGAHWVYFFVTASGKKVLAPRSVVKSIVEGRG